MAGPPLPPPPSFEQAQKPFPEGFLGARVAKYYQPGAAWRGGLAHGKVTEVVNEWQEYEGGPIIRRLLFQLTFEEDGETDDVEWPELFYCLSDDHRSQLLQAAGLKADEKTEQDIPCADEDLPPPRADEDLQENRQQVPSAEGSGKSITLGWVNRSPSLEHAADDDSPPGQPSAKKRSNKGTADTAGGASVQHLHMLQQHQQQQQQRANKRVSPEPIDPAVDDASLPQEPDLRTPVAKRQRVPLSDAAPARPARPAPNKQRAAQQQQQQQQQQGAQQQSAGAGAEDDERPSEAGRLLRMELKDFMCHAHLLIEFGQHVTLVSGANGSGKSAIMQALQAALGVSARNTGRGSSLKAYVRSGATSAHVSVVLNNTGPDRLAEFGSEIAIQRRIAADGGGWYKLGNPKHEVQVKRDAVDWVLERLNINASNPLTIITQDKARTFLADSAHDKRNKYEMFMDGTLLGVTLDCYNKSGSMLNEAVLHLAKYQEHVAKLQRQVEEETQHVQRLREVQQAKEEAKLIDEALGWLSHESMQASIAKQQQQQQANQNMLAAKQADTDKLKEQRVQLQGQADALVEMISSWKAAAEQAVARQRQLKEATKHARARCKEAKQVLESIEEEEEAYQRALSDVRVQLEKDPSKETEAARKASEAAQAQVNAAGAVVKQADAELQAADAKVAEAQEAKTVAQRAVKDADAVCKTAADEVVRIQQEVACLQNSMSDPAHLFGGSSAAKLRAALQQPQNACLFSTPPIGPIGCHIKIKSSHERWRIAADTIVGRLLNHWLVSSTHEEKVLRNLAKRLNMDVSNLMIGIVKMHAGPHHLPADTWPQDRDAYPLVLDALEYEGTVQVQAAVFNYVVDKCSADRTVMVAEDPQAVQVVYGYSLGRFEDQNRNPVARFSAVTVHGRTFSAGATVKKSARDPRMHPRMLKSVAAELELLLQQLQSANTQLVEKQQAAAAARAALADTVAAEREQQRNKQTSQHRKREAEQAFNAACDALRSQGVADDPASQLAAQVAELTRALTQLQQSHAAADTKFQEAKAALAAAEAAQKEDLHATQQQGSSYDEKVKMCDQLLTKDIPALAARIQHQEQLIAKLQAVMLQQEEQLAADKAEQQELLDTLTQSCPVERGQQIVAQLRKMVQDRMRAQALQQWRQQHDSSQHPTDAELSTILDQLVVQAMDGEKLQPRAQKLRKKQAAAEVDAGGSLQELKVKLDCTQARYEKCNVRYEEIDHVLQSLQHGFITRRRTFKDCCRDTKDRVQKHFHKLLARRNHYGLLNVDMEKEELSIKIKVNGKIDPNAQWQSDLKQLSGGERSLVTVALLLAVGAHSESPFRCMDEFDVFMDAVNRLLATEMLLENALYSGRQYIFLTPQDVAGVMKAKEQLESRLKHKQPLETPQLSDHFLMVQRLQQPRS